MDIIELNRNAGVMINARMTKKDNCLDFEWATRLSRIVLNFIGIWPNIHKNDYDKFLSNVFPIFSFIVLVFLGIIPLTQSLVRIWGDLISMTDNLQYTLSITIGTMKLVVVWWKKTDLLIVINMIANDWIKIKTEKERCIMIKHAQNARILTMASYSIMFLGVLFLVVLPCFGKSVRYITNITDPVKILPLPTHYIYDKNRSPYFEFTFVTQVIVILIGAMAYSGVYNLLALLIFHLCGQLENLKQELINIQRDNYNEVVAFVVKEHIRLIECFHIIERIFTLLLLGLLIHFAIIFCLFGFLVVAVLKDGRKMSMIRFLYLVSGITCLVSHTCLICAVGEIFITKCEAIHRAAYEHKWYKIKSQKAKSMVLILIRANKPLYITAGKMFPMTMSMFCNLIKTSAGFISVLLAVQN